MTVDTLALAKSLIEKPSVTPNDAGCLELITSELKKVGFQCDSLPFEDVSNLWAFHGEGSPTLCMVGHTDVVPIGDESKWKTPPFKPTLVNDYLYGRGACDMKGALAAMVTAACQFVKTYPQHPGRLAFIMTSDEEGKALNGTKKVIEWLSKKQEIIDYALVGEPSSEKTLGDIIKIGRRGSLNGKLTIHGIQGHVAYPEKAKNPIHQSAYVLTALLNHTWGESHSDFPETSLQFSNIVSGTGANNVIPGTLEALFNFRFAPSVSPEYLQADFENILRQFGLEFDIEWHVSGLPFITDKESPLIQSVLSALKEQNIHHTQLSTIGGTSDGRFIAPIGADVVEIGPINKTIHQVNESVSVKELVQLTQIYYDTVKHILA